MEHSEQCCCNCKLQLELTKHPWNVNYKGSMSESTGLYACLAMSVMSEKRQAVLFESKHGVCELHEQT